MFSRSLSVLSLVAAAGVLTVGLAGCSASASSSAASGSSSPKSSSSSVAGAGTAGAGDKVTYYNAHPCDLVTEAQTQSLVGYTLQGAQSAPSAGQGKCTYNSVAPIAKPVTFGLDDSTTTAVMIQLFPGATKETIDGHAAFCSEGSGVEDAHLYATVSASAGVLFVTVQSCSNADAMAKIAFGRLG